MAFNHADVVHIGDVDHWEKQIQEWLKRRDTAVRLAENGVTDVYIETYPPELQDKIDRLIGGKLSKHGLLDELRVDKAKTREGREFLRDYFSSFADISINCHKYGIRLHCLSILPGMEERDDVYRAQVKYDRASPEEKAKAKEEFRKAIKNFDEIKSPDKGDQAEKIVHETMQGKALVISGAGHTIRPEGHATIKIDYYKGQNEKNELEINLKKLELLTGHAMEFSPAELIVVRKGWGITDTAYVTKDTPPAFKEAIEQKCGPVSVLRGPVPDQKSPLAVQSSTKSVQEPEPDTTTMPKEDDEYTLYAPPGSYNEKIQTGNARLLILDTEEENEKNPKRHQFYVAHIARRSAEEVAEMLGGKGPKLLFSEQKYSEMPDVRQPGFMRALKQADVVNYSVNFPAIMSLSQRRPGAAIDDFSLPVFVQSLGNEGRDHPYLSTDNFDLKNASAIQRSPYSILVGEASLDKTGKISVDKHSPRSGPTLVAFNPSDRGDPYLYFEDVSRLSPEARKKMQIDENGYVSGLQGTSFAAPVVSGAIAAAKEAFPELGKFELLAAVYSSCNHPNSDDPQICRTASGLKYGQYEWGYGVFDPSKFAEHVKVLEEVHRKYGTLADKKVQQSQFKIDTVMEGQRILREEVKFEISENITAGKLVFRSIMTSGAAPSKEVIVTSPAGTRISIPVSLTFGESDFSTEAFMGEDTKGTWTLSMPDATGASFNLINFASEEGAMKSPGSPPPAQLTIYGQEKGPDGRSNISRFLERVTKPEQKLDINPPAVAPEETKPAAPAAIPGAAPSL